MVVVVEIFRRNFLASMVPVIVNSVLNEHQLVIDIVAFVIKGDFHRSRLGEKQRGKILAGWVTRKMRTIAQYSIRDPNGTDNQITEVAEPGGLPRTSTGTFNRTGGSGSITGSTRGSMRAVSGQMQNLSIQPGAQEYPGQPPQMGYAPPPGLPGMAGNQSYPPSIPELPTDQETPTQPPTEFLAFPADTGSFDFNTRGQYDTNPQNSSGASSSYSQQYTVPGPSAGQTGAPIPPTLQPGFNDDMRGSSEPHYSNKPFLSEQDPVQTPTQQYDSRFDNRDTYSWYGDEEEQARQEEQQGSGQGGGLRITNRDSTSTNDNDDEWAKEAVMYTNLAGSGPEEMRRLE